MNYIEAKVKELEKKIEELERFNTPAEYKLELLRNQIDRVDKKVQELETKTASDLSQLVVAESATGEDLHCLWVARDEGGLFAFSQEPEFFRGEWSSDGDYYKLPDNLLPQITFENSPQKLVLESAISKTETVEDSSGSPEIPEDQSDGYVPTVDDFFYTHEKENSEKPNNQDAFTELRAKLEDLENRYDKEVLAWSFDEILKEIREVIE